MININIVCVGNLKEKYWKDAIQEYQKRISRFADFNIIEVKESSYGSSHKEIEIAKKEEAEKLAKYKKGYLIALEVNGKNYTSESFAENINKIANNGNSTITFFIGGSHGLDAEFSKSLNEQMSFSKLTFPHQLVRVVLSEQIYRAFTILNNITYHK